MKKLFNKLIRRFGVEIKDGYLIALPVQPKYHRCQICKGEFIELPNVNSNRYVFKPEFELKEEIRIDGDGFEAYGWIIEMSWDYGNGKVVWNNHYNHKIYSSEKAAIDAINQMRQTPYYKKNEFRIITLYRVDKSFFRNLTINKILTK